MHDEPLPEWTLEALPSGTGLPLPGPAPVGPLFARVPGCVHLDLLAAGVVDDLAVHGSPADQLWIAQTHWRYRTTVRRPPAPFEHAALVFEGIDTVGEVSVNGVPRLSVRDMHRHHELDVTDDLATGDIEVTVDLDPVLPYAQAREAANPLPRPAAYGRPYNQVRKAAYSFGWDWGPATMTAGLWRPARLVTWTGGRLSDVAVRALPDAGGAGPQVLVDVLVAGVASTIRVTVDDARTAGAAVVAVASAPVVGTRARLALPVPQARPWSPHTEGEPVRYGVTVSLEDATGQPVDRWHGAVGFRSVEVVQRPDADGRSFELHVNGRRVWVRGVDWIPDDLFPARVTPIRYRERLAEAVALGANTVRVWGGGVFEDDAFYDACDELGLLVIQDFLFACGAYPEDAGTLAEVRAEVRDNVTRLRHHPSLALWCGNNENLWGYADWGWQETLGERPWGSGYYHRLLPDLLAELDPGRPYVPGSPFSPDGAHPNDPGRGIVHIWDVWNERDYLGYESWRPRFVAEFGYQGPASWPTLVTAVGGPLEPADPRLADHQRAADGAHKLQAGLDRHLPVPPASGPAWYFATQLLQARAVAVGVHHLRSLHDTCSGAIWWQLNDCWPALSWSVVDVRGRRKLAWHALRRAFDPRLVCVAAPAAGGAGPHVVLVNDTDAPWVDRLTVRLATASTVVEERTMDVDVPPHGSLERPVPVRSEALVVVADVGGRRAERWLVDDLTLDLTPQDVTLSVRRDGDAHVVTVRAEALLRDVCLLAELLDADAGVDGQLVTLLPGESAELRVRLPGTSAPPSAEAWHERLGPLLWSDNRLRHPADAAATVSTRAP